MRAICRCLAVQTIGYYAWQKSPLCQRARDDARQTDLIRIAWNDSGKVYGYRKLHDGLVDHGETCCPSRRGNCHDNAVAESFFSSLKLERIRRRTDKTRVEARQDVFD